MTVYSCYAAVNKVCCPPNKNLRLDKTVNGHIMFFYRIGWPYYDGHVQNNAFFFIFSEVKTDDEVWCDSIQFLNFLFDG